MPKITLSECKANKMDMHLHACMDTVNMQARLLTLFRRFSLYGQIQKEGQVIPLSRQKSVFCDF